MVHGKKAAVVLKHQWAAAWKAKGSQKWLAERVAMVTVNNMKLIAVYQPVSPNEEGIDDYRKTLETAIACKKKEEMLLIGGDHNAQIGRQDNTGGEATIGKFGLPHCSTAGEEIVEWAQLNNLRIVDTFFQKKNRGTWCHPRTGKWYELDYLLARDHQNLKVKDTKAVPEDRWFDHRPKVLKLEIGVTTQKYHIDKRKLKEWESEWWDQLLTNCEEAMQRQDVGEMYSILKQLGLRDNAVPSSEATTISAETFKEHFERVQEQRNENNLGEMLQARKLIKKCTAISDEGREKAKALSATPTEQDVWDAWEKVKEKAPGEDEVRMIYLRAAPPEFKKKVVKMITKTVFGRTGRRLTPRR